MPTWAISGAMRSGSIGSPAALALNLKHNGVLHELVVVMKVVTERSPRVAETGRMLMEELPAGLRDITLRFGFAEKPDVLAP